MKYREEGRRVPLGVEGKKKVRTVLRAALNHALYEDEVIFVNPAARLKLDRKQATEQTSNGKGFWTPEEVTRFLQTTREHEPYYFPLLATMFAAHYRKRKRLGCDGRMSTSRRRCVGG